MNTFARLSCLQSSDKKTVVIYRRGPSKWTQLILWNLYTDQFTYGQWLKGNVYPQKSSISPDGKYISTAIAKYATEKSDNTSYNSWTAISKPPYFTALVTLLEKEGQARGGYFDHEGCFVFDGEKDQVEIKYNSPQSSIPLRFKPYPATMKIYGEFPLHNKKLNESGWKITQAFEGDHNRTISPQIRIKRWNSNAQILLERYTDNFKIITKYYMIINGIKTFMEDVSWVELDYQNRLLMAKNGSVYVSNAILESSSEITFEKLTSFNDSKPKTIPPPLFYYD